MKKLSILLVFSVLTAVTSAAQDLFKVTLHSHREAEVLEKIGTDVLFKVVGGYVVLADADQSEALRREGLRLELLALGIRRDQLAMDGRLDRKNADKFEVLYEDGKRRLLLASTDRLALSDEPVEAYPLHKRLITVTYDPPSLAHRPDLKTALIDIDIEELLSGICEDSLESYVLQLQAFETRLSGTESSWAASEWIADKFTEFGYDGVEIDPFIGRQPFSSIPCQCYNVIARKTGSLYPDQHLVIGGHHDAVPSCPGADDNASGTAAVLELARALWDIETAMTIIFVTFDAEEAGLLGAYHYAYSALERNDDIVLMINADMIAHLTNTNRSNLYYGSDNAYALLWSELAIQYCGLSTDLLSGGSSDQAAFWDAGYDAMFVHEDIFSTHYHDLSDSAVYLNFEYMTRMVQGILATSYTVSQHPPPVHLSLQEPGDGQSQIATWQALDPSAVAYYRLSYYPSSSPSSLTNIDLPPTQSSYTVEGLTDGQEYAFYVQAYDSEGRTSIVYDRVFGTPSSAPAAPRRVFAMPVFHAVKLSWQMTNPPLDFDHFAVVRDGSIICQTFDTAYIDDDPTLGADMHYYHVMAVDVDALESDTVGVDPFWMKAAALQPDRILAVNRSQVRSIDFVDETETGAFMRQALDGYDFDYYSDTAALINVSDTAQLDLIDMVDYGVVVIGAEAGRYDDIAEIPEMNGLLDTLIYYMSIGGKVVVFGRWGDLGERDSLDYSTNSRTYDDPYHDYFHIAYRILTPTIWEYSAGNYSTFIDASLTGAHSKDGNYPYLPWDSLATVAHSTAQNSLITDVSGIPCAAFVELASTAPEVIYAYDSRYDDPDSEGKPVAWRYLGPDYAYIYFDIPLSFFERTSAIAALCRAVDEVSGGSTATPEPISGGDRPNSFALSQNYPNPFNPATEICYSLPNRAHVKLSVYNILGQKVTTLVDEEQPPGTHTVQWGGTDDRGVKVATGVYFYELTAGQFTESRKMLLLK